MNSSEAVEVLNRLLHVLCRSLPMYLRDARPWTGPGQPRAQQAIDNLVRDQHMYAQRVAEAIAELEGGPDPGRFPIEFTAVHDLAIDFLLQKVIEQERRDLAAIERSAADLGSTPSLRSLAEEILGNARGHLEILEKEG
jgi:bacterioferritin (cytochrome b1)